LQEGAQVTTLPMRRIVLDTDFGSGERFAAERAACAGPLHYLMAAWYSIFWWARWTRCCRR
jgi:hypothetical protein